VNAHLAQRARERLGVDLTEAGAAGIVSAIQTGRLAAIPATGEGRAWYETTIQGVRAWVLYDFRTRSLVTLLSEPPANTLPGRVTLFALADEYGLPHAEAKRIAGRLSEPLRHAHKATTVLGYQISSLRPLFSEAAKKEESPMETSKPEGYTLSLIVQKTGIAEGTIKSLLSRHAELQDLPYSAKAAGARVFFDPFVEWLAAHQGAEVAKVAPTATSATRPSAALVREYRLAAKDKLMSPADFRYLVGLGSERTAIAGPPEGKALPEVAAPAFRQLRLVAEMGPEARP
jgi:hypothetical protein